MNIWLFIFLLIIIFSATTGGSYLYFKEKFAFDSEFIADIEARQDREEGESEKGSIRLYGSGEKGGGVKDSVVLRKDTLLVVAEDEIRKYVDAYKVRLLDLYLDKEGVIYIDFGAEVNKNIQGDAQQELDFVKGLYKSVRSTIPGFTALRILIESEEAESLGGHVDISRPIGEEIAKGI